MSDERRAIFNRHTLLGHAFSFAAAALCVKVGYTLLPHTPDYITVDIFVSAAVGTASEMLALPWFMRGAMRKINRLERQGLL